MGGLLVWAVHSATQAVFLLSPLLQSPVFRFLFSVLPAFPRFKATVDPRPAAPELSSSRVALESPTDKLTGGVILTAYMIFFFSCEEFED